MPKTKGNCPMCGSQNCTLTLSDFIGKKKEKNPLAHLTEREDFKDHMKRIKKDIENGYIK